MKYVGLDIESVGTELINPIIWSISLRYEKKKVLITDCFGVRKVPADVKRILEDEKCCKVIHNAAFDGTYIEMVLGIKLRNVWCTMSAETIINSYSQRGKKKRKDGKIIFKNEAEQAMHETFGISLDFVLPRYGFAAPDKNIRNNFINRPKGLAFTKEELAYMDGDTDKLLKLQKMQEFILVRDNQLEIALLENKTAERIMRMRTFGIKMDISLQKRIYQKNLDEYNRRLSKLPKQVENWGSEKQVKKYFFNRGILIQSYSDLEEVYAKTKNQTLRDFINAKELKKAVTAYGINLLEFINPKTGRIHCDVYQIKDTGRMSMANPNLQQIPRTGDFRSAYVPEKGNCFVDGDFSGQEIGIMAAMAEEKIWIDALLRGDDVHGLTASLLYANEWEMGAERGCTFPKKCKCKVHLDLREKAKTLNFMLAYGGGPLKFSMSTGLTMFESKLTIKRYKKIIPNITKALETNGKLAVQTGETFSADPYKRRRLLLSDKEWHVENQGKNTPIQGAGANMLKLAMISLPEKINIAVVIHDQIITEQPIKLGEQNRKILKSVMEKSADYITGIKGLIKVDPKICYNLQK